MKMIKMLSIQYIALILLSTSVMTVAPFTILTESPSTRSLGYGNWDIATDGESLIMQKLIKPDSIVFDVGGNLGEWTEHALHIDTAITLFTFSLRNRITWNNVVCASL